QAEEASLAPLGDSSWGQAWRNCRRRASIEKGHLLAFSKPSDGLEPSTPSLPSRVPGKRMQLQAAGCRDSRAFRSGGTCSRLRGFASALLHKCSIPTGVGIDHFLFLERWSPARAAALCVAAGAGTRRGFRASETLAQTTHANQSSCENWPALSTESGVMTRV